MPVRLSVTLTLLLVAGIGCKKRGDPDTSHSTSRENGTDQKGGPGEGTQPAANAALQTLRGRGAVLTDESGGTGERVVRAYLIGSTFGDEAVAMLRTVPSLTTVDLSGSKVTDAGLATLGDLPNLRSINLSGTAVTDAGVTRLSKLTQLRQILLENTRISDVALDALGKLPALNHVNIRKTQVTEAGIARLKATRSGIQVVEDMRFVPYTSPDGRFQASFPWRQPSVRTRTERTPFGMVNDTAYEVDEQNWSVLIAVADLNTPQLASVTPEQLANAGREGISQALGATVSKDERTDYGGGNVVRTITFELPKRPRQGPIYFRYVIQGRRLYTLGILIDGGTVAVADRDRFFNSFRILK